MSELITPDIIAFIGENQQCAVHRQDRPGMIRSTEVLAAACCWAVSEGGLLSGKIRRPGNYKPMANIMAPAKSATGASINLFPTDRHICSPRAFKPRSLVQSTLCATYEWQQDQSAVQRRARIPSERM